jgi:CheY-like chemotaxis protein
LKVMVIEDNPVDLRLVEAILHANGDEFGGYSNANDAVQLVREQRPDVLLLDLNLPGTDGIALIHELRSHADLSLIPILAMTAYPHRYRSAALAMGIAGCLSKPIDTRQLVDRLQEAAARGRAESS